MPGVDAECEGEGAFDGDLVLDGDDGEAGPVGHAVVSPRARPGRPLASSEHVRAHDEEAVGVDRRARPDERSPPPGARMAGLDRSDHVRVTAQGVQDQDRVGGERVELAPGLIGDRHAVEATACLELQGGLSRCPTEKRDELSTAGVVARPPGPGDRGIGHGCCQLRRPWRSGSPPRGRRGCPRESRGQCRAGPGPGLRRLRPALSR